MLNYVTLVLPKPPKSMQPQNMANSEKTSKRSPKLKEIGQKMKKIFLRKSAIFQPLMRGTAKQHGFLHIGANLVAKRTLGQMGADPPHFHMHIGKIGQFFRIRVFP